MKWQASDFQEGRVRQWKAWYHLHDVPFVFPEACGVFVFATLRLQVKYIGCASLRTLRDEASLRLDHEGKGATVAAWLETSSHEDALALCSDLRKKYSPPRRDTGSGT